MPSLSPELWTALAIGAGLLLTGIVGRVWKPMRKAVVVVDVISGRPARYPGDPEERPGLAERFDRVDASIAELRAGMAEVKSKVDKIEGCSE
jgi:hypothetical protein